MEGKIKKSRVVGTSLAVQWPRLCIPMQGMWVQSLVKELRSHTSHSVGKKKKIWSYIYLKKKTLKQIFVLFSS